jgi:hypothetical protein
MAHQNLDGTDVPLSACSCHAMHGESYRFFTNLSGLFQASSARLYLLEGAFRSLNRLNQEERTESHALSRGPMTLIVLAMTCLLACAFYIYVLCQWMRETKGKRTTPPPIAGQSGGTQENKRPYIMGSRKNTERHDSPDVSSHRVPRMTWLSRGRGLGWNESERIAYRKIASSLSLRKRS